MKNVLIFRNLLLIFVVFLIVSCSKKSDEVAPSSLTGKWKQNGITGKVIFTENGQSITENVNEPADNSIIEFKTDGTATFDGDMVKYTLQGSNLTLGEGTQAVTFVAKVTGSNLTLSFTKDEFFKLLALLGDPNDPETKAFLDLKNKITLFEYNTNYVKQ